MDNNFVFYLEIKRFRGLSSFQWWPRAGLNVVLGGGDVGKSTILDALALLFNPSSRFVLSDADYLDRQVASGFTIEAVVSAASEAWVSSSRALLPWVWDGKRAVLPTVDDEFGVDERPGVYKVRAIGTADQDLVYEVLQPNESTEFFSTGIRRAFGVVRLTDDDRGDRDLRLVQGSALDRLVGDPALRGRLASHLATDPKLVDQLTPDAQAALSDLDGIFTSRALPSGLSLGLVSAPGLSVASLVGLTANKQAGVVLPLESWGSGTRRMAGAAIADAEGGDSMLTLIDEAERGLEPYRQRQFVIDLSTRERQTILTTHSIAIVKAAADATLWYLDQQGCIGELPRDKIEDHQAQDPEAFLARFVIVAEGPTEVGFVCCLLDRFCGTDWRAAGLHVTSAGGNARALKLLEGFRQAGVSAGGFVDDEGTDSGGWGKIRTQLGDAMWQWPGGSTETSVLPHTPLDKLRALIEHRDHQRSWGRRRSIADRLSLKDDSFEAIFAAAEPPLILQAIIKAASGDVPSEADETMTKQFKRHQREWFKSRPGGYELCEKMFNLGLWQPLAARLTPFIEAARHACLDR